MNGEFIGDIEPSAVCNKITVTLVMATVGSSRATVNNNFSVGTSLSSPVLCLKWLFKSAGAHYSC